MLGHVLQPAGQQPGGVLQAVCAGERLGRPLVDLQRAGLPHPVVLAQGGKVLPGPQGQAAVALAVGQQRQCRGLQAFAPAAVHPFNRHGAGIHQGGGRVRGECGRVGGAHVPAEAQGDLALHPAQAEHRARRGGHVHADMHARLGQGRMDQGGTALRGARLPVAGHAALGPPAPGARQGALHGAGCVRVLQHEGHVLGARRALAQLARPPQGVGNRIGVRGQLGRHLGPVGQDVLGVILGQQVQAQWRLVGKGGRALGTEARGAILGGIGRHGSASWQKLARRGAGARRIPHSAGGFPCRKRGIGACAGQWRHAKNIADRHFTIAGR